MSLKTKTTDRPVLHPTNLINNFNSDRYVIEATLSASIASPTMPMIYNDRVVVDFYLKNKDNVYEVLHSFVKESLIVQCTYCYSCPRE